HVGVVQLVDQRRADLLEIPRLQARRHGLAGDGPVRAAVPAGGTILALSLAIPVLSHRFLPYLLAGSLGEADPRPIRQSADADTGRLVVLRVDQRDVGDVDGGLTLHDAG